MWPQLLTHVQLFVILCTIAHQVPLSMRLSWQEYWSKLPFPPPGDLPHLGMDSISPALAGRSFTTEPPGKSLFMYLFVVLKGFPGSSAGKGSLAGKERLAGKESACNSGDPCSILRSGISPGKGIGYPLQYFWASLVAQMVKNQPAMQETWLQSLGWEDPWRRAWQPTPVFLPGESSWTGEPGRLQSVGSPRAGHHLGTKPPPPGSKKLNFPMAFRERLLKATFRVRVAGYMTFF